MASREPNGVPDKNTVYWVTDSITRHHPYSVSVIQQGERENCP